jgi:transcriptional repressor NrdR
VRCPGCGRQDTSVIDSRDAEDGAAIRRRRECPECGHRFTTFERAESARIQVVKRDGSREEFDRAKLASSIAKAGGKSLTPEQVSRVVHGIEAGLRKAGMSEVESGKLGQLVLEQLEALDPMAFIRFKIVYAGLQDPNALYDELGTLVRRRERAREAAEQIALPLESGGAAEPRGRPRKPAARKR